MYNTINFKLHFHQTLLHIFRQRFLTKNWRNETEKKVVRNGFIHHARELQKLTAKDEAIIKKMENKEQQFKTAVLQN